MTPSKWIAYRLASGDITPADYDLLAARLGPAEISSASSADVQFHLQLYSIFRDYIKHEDDLINQRLSWFLTLQGFFFAAYALALQKSVESWTTLSSSTGTFTATDSVATSLMDVYRFSMTLAAVGFCVSVVVFLGVHAASTALG